MENKPAASAVPALREERPPLLIMEGDPEAQIQFAQRVAAALMQAVLASPRLVMTIGGNRYLKFGAWQVVSRPFGCTVGTDWSRPIERDGKIAGWECRAVVYRHGEIISTAEAMCLRTERNWAKRDEFAIRSMAQTRAGGKAMRNAFGWIAELGGYQSTPAEEMEDENGGADHGNEAAPQSPNISERVLNQAGRSVPIDSEYDPTLITSKQADYLIGLLEKLPSDDRKQFLSLAKVKKVEDLPASKYPNAEKWLEGMQPDAGKIT